MVEAVKCAMCRKMLKYRNQNTSGFCTACILLIQARKYKQMRELLYKKWEKN